MAEQTLHASLAESISALVDNQASELELQRILKAGQTDPEVKKTWARYQIVSAAMRHDLPVLDVTDFAMRISTALEGEETHGKAASELLEPIVKPVHWWQNLTRFAVAASVAGGVILFAQNPGVIGDAPVMATAQPAAVTTPAVSIPSGYHAQPLSLRTVGMQSGYEARQQDNRQVMFIPRQSAPTTATVTNEELVEYFNKLVEAHADNAALNSSQGMLPFARVILTDQD